MAARNVMVEICLTSNDVILGVQGAQHPLHAYRKYGVPVALATDDQGVSRADMTSEYVRAVEDQELTYDDLKTMARTSLEHSFLPGQSLWADGKALRHVAACGKDFSPSAHVSSDCGRFLKQSEKAATQWRLEQAFSEFEKTF
jgi:adenosine deaminase